MRLLLLTVAAGILAITSGCATAYGPAYGGIITSNVKGPVAVGDSTAGMSKRGTATATAIVFFASGDASISAAMQNGGIKKIHHVDSEVFTLLNVYATYKTTVYGE